MTKKKNNLSWEDYFERENKSLFQILVSLYRKLFISNSVKYYTDKYFPDKGIFIEAGAGTSQSSERISRRDRKLVALDYNHYVLARHNVMDNKIQGNIFSLPFKSRSIDGLWNLGVMEHLTDSEIILALKEFSRVIKDNGIILLYWPPYFAPFEVVLNSTQWFLKKIFNKEVEFFPNVINLYKNRKRMIDFINKVDLKLVRIDFNILDLFTNKVVIARV